MGLFSDITDTLFGSTDDSSQEAQIQANARAQDFIEQQAALARGDAIALQPLGDQYRNESYQTAIDMLRGAAPQQIDLTARGNIAGQETLLAGLPQIQNAILGMPVDMGALQTTDLRTPDMLDWMQGAQLPQMPADYGNLLGGGTGDYSVNFTPGETNNRAMIEQAYKAGLISDSDYQWLQEWAQADPGSAGSTRWSTANPDQWLAGINTSTFNDQNKDIMRRLVGAIYPNQPGAA